MSPVQRPLPLASPVVPWRPESVFVALAASVGLADRQLPSVEVSGGLEEVEAAELPVPGCRHPAWGLPAAQLVMAQPAAQVAVPFPSVASALRPVAGQEPHQLPRAGLWHPPWEKSGRVRVGTALGYEQFVTLPGSGLALLRRR